MAIGGSCLYAVSVWPSMSSLHYIIDALIHATAAAPNGRHIIQCSHMER